jgi:glycerol-1-phosphate dehydrogenase [NAD(P)+]
MVTASFPVENMSSAFTPHRIIAKDAITAIGSVVEAQMPSRALLLVCDDTTWSAAGQKVQSQLPAGCHVTPYSLGRRVKPSFTSAEKLAQEASAYDGLVAVGSGSVNDLTKYAAAQSQKPYLCVTTAASMNGYSSANASLDKDGMKQSFAAVTPRAIIADTTVLAAAPKRMTRAGLADTLCRSSVEADMLLSHWLLDTPYPRALFDGMRRHEAGLMTAAADARDGSTDFVAKLMEALLDAGDAMSAHGSSAPASQGEHMIAHTLELMYGSELHNVLHGEMIALTTLTMNQLQHKMLLGLPSVKVLPPDGQKIERLFGKKVAAALSQQYAKKLLNSKQAHSISARLEKDWPEIKAALVEIMASPNSIERAFIHSGTATHPQEIGFSEERYRFACTYAHLTRDRFTFLDLATMNDKRIS